MTSQTPGKSCNFLKNREKSSTDTADTVHCTLILAISVTPHEQNIEQDSCAVRQPQHVVEHSLKDVGYIGIL